MDEKYGDGEIIYSIYHWGKVRNKGYDRGIDHGRLQCYNGAVSIYYY